MEATMTTRRSTSYSSLNPNAPLFIPGVYREVEDFSSQWWELVNSSAWFRDYWLQECFQDDDDDFNLQNDCEPVLPDHIDSIFYFDAPSNNTVEEKDFDSFYKELVSLEALKWRTSGRGGRRVGMVESHTYLEKAPKNKFVNIKVSPRAIQQPR